MESPASEDRRERILEAALALFSEVGFAKATIKRIAARADVKSPALIYFYFSDKAALLRAVIERYALLLGNVDAPDPTGVEAPPEIHLAEVASGALAFLDNEEVRQTFRLWMTEWPLLEELGVNVHAGDRTENAHAYLERYLAEQVRQGRLAPHDTAAAARSFVAQVWAQAEAKALFPSIYPQPPDDREFVASMIPLFLRGLSV